MTNVFVEAALLMYAPMKVHFIRSQSAAIDLELHSMRLKLAEAVRAERQAAQKSRLKNGRLLPGPDRGLPAWW